MGVNGRNGDGDGVGVGTIGVGTIGVGDSTGSGSRVGRIFPDGLGVGVGDGFDVKYAFITPCAGSVLKSSMVLVVPSMNAYSEVV